MSREEKDVFICGAGVVSALGSSPEQVSRAFCAPGHAFQHRSFNGTEEWVAPLSADSEQLLERIRGERGSHERLDRSVLMAIAAARSAFSGADWKDLSDVGVVVGSSRGATATFEQQYKRFSEHQTGRTDVWTSPTTTLGNLSTAVAQDLGCEGIEISHSITCSTALHSVLSAVGWIHAGMGNRFLAGGSEAALTDFTIAQMKALRIYTSESSGEYPCRPLEEAAGINSFALGEGAVMFALEGRRPGVIAGALARIEGLGWGIEHISSLTSMSREGASFVKSMRRALDSQRVAAPVDLIVAHSPGTVMGDRSERAAVEEVFGKNAPLMVSPKWQIGHTFGASGGFGILQALTFLNGAAVTVPPYLKAQGARYPDSISRVMVNAAGFGGNSTSVILSRVDT